MCEIDFCNIPIRMSAASVTSAWLKWQQLSWMRQRSGVWRGRPAPIRQKKQPAIWPWSSVHGPWAQSLSEKRKVSWRHIRAAMNQCWSLLLQQALWLKWLVYSQEHGQWVERYKCKCYSVLNNTLNAFAGKRYQQDLYNSEFMYTSAKKHYFRGCSTWAWPDGSWSDSRWSGLVRGVVGLPLHPDVAKQACSRHFSFTRPEFYV